MCGPEANSYYWFCEFTFMYLVLLALLNSHVQGFVMLSILPYTVYSRYKHTVRTGGGMLITNLCIYREKITYMTKQTKETKETRYRY